MTSAEGEDRLVACILSMSVTQSVSGGMLVPCRVVL